MSLLSVIIPSFNEEENIENTAETLRRILLDNHIDYELIFVDDGSRDKTFTRILEQAQQDARVLGIRFSRNFGKEACIFAGLEKARGDCCAVMDCDLQHPPATLVDMYRLWEEGYQVIEGVKSARGKESFFYKISAKLFYKMISKVTHFDMEKSSDFKLLDRQVVDALLTVRENQTFFRALSYWVGFKSVRIEYEVAERKFGKSKWSLGGLMRYAINNVSSFTAAPLHIVTACGAVMIVFSIILFIYTLVQYIIQNTVEGLTTVIILILIIGGAIMISLGIIGFYLGKIYDEVKGRPRYIISQQTDQFKK